MEKILFPSVTIICFMPEDTNRNATQRMVAAMAIFVRGFTIASPAIS
jgi:hypothetical protein